MSIYHDNLERATKDNESYRKVVFTGQKLQLVLMSLLPKEEIGLETHAEHDQFIRVEAGQGKAVIGGEEFELSADMAVIVPAGSEHNILNTSETEKLKLYTIYAPPEHPEGTEQATKPEQD